MKLRDRTIAWSIFALALFVYGFFFQGDNSGLRANWLTTRMLVEKQTFAVTQFYLERPGDYSIYRRHVYSNKPPGVPLLGVIPYWPIYHLERAAHFDPLETFLEFTNARIITFFSCGIPGAALAAMMFIALRRRNASQAVAAGMSIAFAFGTIVLPYTGLLYSHVLVTACYFGAWLILRGSATAKRLAIASTLLGLAVISDYLIVFPVGAMIIFDLYDLKKFKRFAILCIGPAIALIGLMWYQHAIFGSAFAASYKFEDISVNPNDNTFTARFGWPEWRRLYWVTFQPLRGLFYCCPVFIVCFLSLLMKRKWTMSRDDAFGWFVIAWFTLFEMTYVFWTGGWGIGPRFAMPALPFLFLLTQRGFERFPLASWMLAGTSTLIMLMVTMTEPHYMANLAGPPIKFNPIASNFIYFWLGRIARTRRSTNWLIDIGFYSSWDIVPLILIIGLALFGCWKLREQPRPVALT